MALTQAEAIDMQADVDAVESAAANLKATVARAAAGETVSPNKAIQQLSALNIALARIGAKLAYNIGD